MFLFKLKIKTNNIDTINLSAYDRKFKPLPCRCYWENNIATVEIQTGMPGQILLPITGLTNANESLELVELSLVGITINKELLTNLTEYKVLDGFEVQDGFDTLLNAESHRSLIWDQNGCVLFNLFDTNPFAYLLYVGNKIKF